MTTIFGKILREELPCKKVYEDEHVLAFEDVNPVAPVHVLIIPKKEISNIQSVQEEDLPLIGKMVAAAQKIARDLGVEEGYRLVVNNGAPAGQTVFHLHFHLIAGRQLRALA